MLPVSVTGLETEFQRNIDALSLSLIKVFSLKFKQEVPNLSNPLMRWLDFRLRYIDPQPRQIILSNKFPKRGMPQNTKSAFKKICKLIEAGRDINPYQGRGLILRNDFSGERHDARTDLLWADWDIYHLHLSNEPIPPNQYFSRPADYLAFCLVGGNLIAFIDILRHPSKEGFANPELIETVAQNWPRYMDQFQLHGISPSRGHTQDEIHTLRSNGCTPSLTINNTAYIGPGMGITSAATPTKVTLTADRVRAFARDLAVAVQDPSGSFRTETITALEEQAEFSLAPTAHGLVVYEAKSQHAFHLPESQPYKAPTPMEAFHDLLLPKWACQALVASTVDTVVLPAN